MSRFALPARQGPAAAGALAAAAGGARALPARAGAARRRRARRPGRPAARGLRQRGRHPGRRPLRRPRFDFGSIVRQAGRRVELVRMTRPQARRALARRRRRGRDRRAARLRLRSPVADREPERAAADQPQRLPGADPARGAGLRLHAQQRGADRVHPLQQRFPRRARARRRGEVARPHLQRARPGRDARAHRRRASRSCLPDSPARAQLDSVVEFAGQASAALGLAHQALEATAHPVRLVQRSTSGRSYLLGSQVQSYGLAISLAFVTLLLGAAVLTLERDENVLARLLRSGARPALLVAREGDPVRDRRLRPRPAARAGLRRRRRDLVLGRGLDASPAAARAARGLRGGLRRARLRRRRGGARPARRLARGRRPDHADRPRRPRPAQVSPVAAAISELLPFVPASRAFGATLFDSEPISTVLGATAHLLLLTAVLSVATLALFRRFQS